MLLLHTFMQQIYSQFHTISIHPLITFTICLMLGIWFATGISNIPLMLTLLGACCVYHGIAQATIKIALVAIMLCVVAFFLGAGLSFHQRRMHAHMASSLQEGPYDALARVTDIQKSDKAHYPYTVYFELTKLKKATYGKPWQEHTASIAAFCEREPYIEIDDLVYLEECSFSRHDPTTSFNEYLIKSGIHGTLFCHHLTYTLLERPPYSYQRAIATLKNDVFDRIRTKMSDTTAAFYASLFLGNCQTYKTYLKEMKSQFGIWGLSHFLARSGLHLVLFIFLWHLLFGYIPVRSRYKYIIMLLLNTIYLLLSWTSLSFMRSFAAVCLYHIAHIWQQQVSSLHVITLITCCCLLMNPMQLFFLDFQLSFGLTFALAWIYQAYSWHRLTLNTNS